MIRWFRYTGGVRTDLLDIELPTVMAEPPAFTVNAMGKRGLPSKFVRLKK
jgi:hypothetical protein